MICKKNTFYNANNEYVIKSLKLFIINLHVKDITIH